MKPDQAERRERMRRRIEGGETYAAIGRDEGISVERVSQLAEKMGLPKRRAGRPRKETRTEVE